MKFLTDENVSPLIIRNLRQARHDVWDVKENGWQESPDSRIMQLARRTRRVIISEDLDFGNLQRFPLEDHPGAILLHFSNMHRKNVAHRLHLFLAQTKPRTLKNAVHVLEDRKTWKIAI